MGSAERIADGMSKLYVIGVLVELCEDIHGVLKLSVDWLFDHWFMFFRCT